MGQQQLILLVLATVIVGLAIVVGITAFTENSNRANADAMMQDAVRIANDVQAWAQKPPAFGGPAAGDDFTTASFPVMGYPESAADEYTNTNGVYTLAGDADVLIEGTGLNADAETIVQVRVCGLNDWQIAGAITQIGGQDTGNAPAACADLVDPNAGV